MPIRFREPAQRPGFLHRQRPLHAVLGGGKRKIFFFYQNFKKNVNIHHFYVFNAANTFFNKSSFFNSTRSNIYISQQVPSKKFRL